MDFTNSFTCRNLSTNCNFFQSGRISISVCDAAFIPILLFITCEVECQAVLSVPHQCWMLTSGGFLFEILSDNVEWSSMQSCSEGLGFLCVPDQAYQPKCPGLTIFGKLLRNSRTPVWSRFCLENSCFSGQKFNEYDSV